MGWGLGLGLGEKVVESRGIGTGSSKRDEVHQDIVDF